MDNLAIYNKYAVVPPEAQKPIKGGRLSGMTDINPMWRIKCLTEQFGAVGIGWYPKIISQWLETGADGNVTAFCNIELYVKQDGEWSMPIPGTGGSMLVAKERSGLFTSDECYKMAFTDALSVACKLMGFGANIYWAAGSESKYSHPQTDDDPLGKGISQESVTSALVCSVCSTKITKAIHTLTTKRYGRPLCLTCQPKEGNNA
jgi:hypothetical protein